MTDKCSTSLLGAEAPASSEASAAPLFTPTHEFHLLDGTIVYVMAELRGDWVAREIDGTYWHTVCGDLYPEWGSRARGIMRIRKVVKYGHRYHVAAKGKSYRFECECRTYGNWVRSAGGALRRGAAHHWDAVYDARQETGNTPA